MPEYHHQCAVYDWWCVQYPKLQRGFVMGMGGVHLQGGPKHRAIQMAKLKKQGFQDGVSDIQIAIPRGEYHGLWLELKDEGKTAKALSTDQVAHLAFMELQGYATAWAAGVDKAINIIELYMVHGLVV